MAIDYTRGLHEVGPDVWAWLLPDGEWGMSNAGLVRGVDQSFLVDTLFDLPLTTEMLDALAGLVEAAPIAGALNTHANGDHCFGNQLLGDDVKIHATRDTDHEIHHGTTPERLQMLVSSDFGPVTSEFLRSCFGAFDFEGIALRGADVTFDDELTVDVGGRAVELLRLGPAHTAGDAIAHVPDAKVVFAGDLLFIGGTPIMWAGSLENWMRACDRMAALDPDVVVPGHGPVTDVDGIAEMRRYLAHVTEGIADALAAGRPWREAADRMDLDRFASWPQAERIVVTTYHAYRQAVAGVPAEDGVHLFGEMAAWRQRHAGRR
ncbi:MBL fold metallo-hydrolase [Nocardioides carbamazepini]|jgi:glyoxylase-like metal-dependent hydrolase (beta-lactamase superfamily II)|uniref:MBL fold metallo-hydrolase n=1 Tax=Nocardioides carbamazepini TaxID=2854259 RepID=UPI00214A2C8D|nr:MBL fold metallo-hydrolase [Nocardioides carbamazepini]MCR1786732.1 MBL fold metallo-hydrolase [Nocardioides carbamazepini]